jgi:polysaccharide biosynthesis protein PslG
MAALGVAALFIIGVFYVHFTQRGQSHEGSAQASSPNGTPVTDWPSAAGSSIAKSHHVTTGGNEAHAAVFGMADPSLLGESPSVQASQLAAMKAIGITSIRLDADWRSVQPSGPQLSDWSELDQAVASVRQAGMSLDLIIDGCPPWAALPGARRDPSPQPASSSQYATFAAEVAARYKSQGVDTFEIWNEPNIKGFWQPAPNPAAYTADLIAAYSAIKAVDRHAYIISGGLAPGVTRGPNMDPVDFLQAMYADGARGHFDAVGFHPYSFPTLPNTYWAGSGWSQIGQTRPSIRSIMVSNGDGNKQIWLTEFGAPSKGQPWAGPTAQASAISQAIIDVKSVDWIGALYLYTWQDSGGDPNKLGDWFGLMTSGGARKPAYATVAGDLR